MYFNGLIIGIITFVIIGVFHPLVIKIEYYFGAKSWIGFCLAGIFFVLMSLFTANMLASVSFGVIGFSCFWSIKEIFEQVKRVQQGRYPKNPKRKYGL